MFLDLWMHTGATLWLPHPHLLRSLWLSARPHHGCMPRRARAWGGIFMWVTDPMLLTLVWQLFGTFLTHFHRRES